MTKKKRLLLHALLAQRPSIAEEFTITHTDDRWVVSSKEATLMRPNGSIYFDTPQLAFRVLASAGITSAVVEWVGLDPFDDTK